MGYYIDAENIALNDLRTRIQETDLVPSRLSLLDGIEINFKKLEQYGIKTLAHLRHGLKTSKRLEAVANATAIDRQYLILLRREIESYFPKPFVLKAFDWLSKDLIEELEENGIRDTETLYQAGSSSIRKAELARSAGVDVSALDALFQLADLTRVQWVSPTAARMLVEAGYESSARLAEADAEILSEALLRVNEGGRFFKGKIGLRDIKRLIRAAGYIPK
jgi:isopentenyl diphosphate isomerase/L-lactate dehydrogenase-like FMN-dependent dehydrogenase